MQGLVEIISLTDQSVRVVAETVEVPEDVVVDSVQTTSCSASTTDFLCRHTMVFDYSSPLSFNGSYALNLRDECQPGALWFDADGDRRLR